MSLQLPEGLTTGQRIKAVRESRGMARPVLAALVGRSEGWLKAVEGGRLHPPRLPMLVKLATALKVADLSELTGAVSMPTEMFAATEHPALTVVRRAVDAAPLGLAGGPAPNLDHVAAALATGWKARDTRGDHRTALGKLLPSLITSASVAASHPEISDPRRAQVLYASALNLTQMFAAYQADGNLVWRVAERSLATARAAGDPAAIAQSCWFLVQAFRESGQWDSAQTLTEDALRLLDPVRDDSPELLSAWASMAFHAAITHARAGESGVAWGWHTRAAKAASRLPDGWWSSPTSASPAAVPIHAVTVAVELRQPGTAFKWARKLDDALIPARPRRARHLIEVARAHQMVGEHDKVADLVGQALETASETPRWNQETYDLVRGLLDGPTSVRPAARRLAAQVGVAA
jgi:transcriptional regulator with XRE-family HTH domain